MDNAKSPRLKFPRKAVAPLVVGILVAAIVAPALFFGFAATDQRVTNEWYNYLVAVRVSAPSGPLEVMVPTPDFPDLVAVIEVTSVFAGYNSTNVGVRLTNTASGLMFAFTFDGSFAAFGSLHVPPGAAAGTLTLSTQTSNRTSLFLSGVSGNANVSVLVYYERVQLCCFRAQRHSFIGTTDPRSAPQVGLVVTDDYLGWMLDNPFFHRLISPGWNSCPLVDGAFATLV